MPLLVPIFMVHQRIYIIQIYCSSEITNVRYKAKLIPLLSKLSNIPELANEA